MDTCPCRLYNVNQKFSVIMHTSTSIMIIRPLKILNCIMYVHIIFKMFTKKKVKYYPVISTKIFSLIVKTSVIIVIFS